MAKPTAAQLAKINRFAKEPLTEEDAYVHKFRLIGTRFIPSRFLKFDASMLSIYKKFVNNGDVVQIADHSFGGFFSRNITLPFGRFFESETVDADGETHLDGTMYMKAGQKTYLPGGFTTDDIDAQLNAGTLHDSSVTVSWGKSECSICGNDFRDYENCPHWPGQTYKVHGQDMQCFIIAKPAPKNDRSMMIENSIVCAGAYPDAGALGALSNKGDTSLPRDQKGELIPINSMAELKLVKQDASVYCLLSSNAAKVLIAPEDKLDVAELHDLYHRMYKEDLPEGWTMTRLVREHTKAVEALISSEQKHYLSDALDGNMPANLKKLSFTTKGDESKVELLDQLCELLGCTKEELLEKVKGTQGQLAIAQSTIGEKDKEIERLTAIEAKVKDLEPLAEVGKQYRQDLIDDALKWGVRAYADKFNEEVNRKMLGNSALSLDDIKAVKAQYEEVAKQAIAAGRLSNNDGGDDGKDTMKSDDSLYSVK